VFLPRHGSGHTIPPHKVNYRANVYALKEVGVTQVIGMAAVGGITPRMAPGEICIPTSSSTTPGDAPTPTSRAT